MKKFWSFLLILLMVSCCGCSKPPQTLTVSVYGGETEINHYEEIENGFLSALEANGLRGYRLVDSSELTTNCWKTATVSQSLSVVLAWR